MKMSAGFIIYYYYTYNFHYSIRMRLGQARLKFSYITSMIRTNSSLSRGREQWISLDRNLYSKVSTVTKERERESQVLIFSLRKPNDIFGRNQMKDIWEKPNERHLGETK